MSAAAMKEAATHNRGALLLRLFDGGLPDPADLARAQAHHPDAKLLALCVEALQFARAADEARDNHGVIPHWTEGERVAWEADHAARRDAYRQAAAGARRVVVQAIKLQATTPAGIYAKALLMRCSAECATDVAISMAADLLDDRPPVELEARARRMAA